MCGLGPENAVRWETQSGSRQPLRHPRMENHVLTLWETGFCLLSEVSLARHI